MAASNLLESKKKFPKSSRLLLRKDFQSMYRTPCHYVGQFCVIDIRGNQKPHSRLGITVAKRYGKAHERNRFKRVVREAFRNSMQLIPVGIDLHFKPRTKSHEVKSQDVANELLAACVRWSGSIIC